ncbi:branched-chain amino acid ABC transporter ATP-binding protein/permease [Actinophytocola sp.]|uniref:branched-chain amino acid ABC transporter ATP-binding protein/permease n=1 Tax=Actinophytocola sp. TaxID=1872138 RepID=UPI003D6AD891
MNRPARLGALASRLALWFVAIGVPAVFMWSLWGISGGYLVTVLQLTIVLAILTYSVDLVLGYGGLVSVAHGCLYGIGLYTVAILTTRFGTGFWLALLCGCLAACVVGGVFAVITLRLSGHYFTFASVVFGAAAFTAFDRFDGLTGGPRGISGVPRIPPIGPLRFDSDLSLTLLLLFALGLVVLLISAIARSQVGDRLVASRDNARLAQSLGVNVARVRIFVFLMSAPIAAFAGGLYVSLIGYASPADADVLTGFDSVMYALLGGSGQLLGPSVGAVLGGFVPEALRAVPELRLALFGLVLIIVIVWRPKGIVGIYRELFAPLRAVRRSPTASGVVSSDELVARPSLRQVRHPSGPEVVLAVESLKVRYGGVTALDDVALTVGCGELLAVIGPNGAGKSTLFDAVAGRVQPERGTIRLLGENISRAPVHRRAAMGVCRTFQAVELFRSRTVFGHLRMAARHTDLGADRVDGARPCVLRPDESGLRFLGLYERRHEYPETLSLSEQQRLAIGLALVRRPAVLLLDEPFAGLSGAGQRELMEIIRELKDGGLSICLIEHKMHAVMALADRIVVLNEGKVLRTGTPEAVRGDETVLKAYLGAKYAQVRES